MIALASVLFPLLLAVAPLDPDPTRVLVITGGGFHDFTANPKLLLEGLKSEIDLAVTRLELPADGKKPAEGQPEPGKVLDANLRARFDAILIYTQGEILGLDNDARDSLLHFVRSGGGLVAIHCAADTMKWNRDYVAMVGGKFKTHPPFCKYKVRRALGDHPVLTGITDMEVEDEFYYLDACRLDDKNVLLTGEGPSDGQTRPLAWTKSYGEGRVFTTVLGHGPQTHGKKEFHKLIGNGLRWVTEAPHWSKGKDGWRTLFDGKSLDGWTMSGPGKFDVKDGELLTDGGMGLLWFSALELGDFEFECEWAMTKADDNSGVFVRFPMPRTPWDAVNQGYEIQICDAADAKHSTGSVYSFQAPTKKASKPIGEWNRYRIRVRGQHYEVTLNDEVVCTYDGNRSTRGYVGLQNHSAGQVVRFRNLRVREL